MGRQGKIKLRDVLEAELLLGKEGSNTRLLLDYLVKSNNASTA